MKEKKLIIDNFTNSSRSYVDCLYALLTSAGLFHLPKYMLSGMTGKTFKFVIHKRLLPSSLDMYSWPTENWSAVNRLGIYNETYAGSPMEATFPLYQQQMLQKIITSINQGRSVIGWGIDKPQFCLYTGYQEDDRVLFYRNSNSKEEGVVLYENLGLISEGVWFFQIIGDKIEKDNRDIFRESLECAVNEWNLEYKVRPEYGAGKRAYLNLLEAFQSKDFNYGGAYYILGNYLDIKLDICSYMDMVIKEIPELADVAGLYHKMAGIILPLKQFKLIGNPEEDLKYIPEAINTFRDAMQTEEKAIIELEKYLHDYIHNKNVNPDRVNDLY